MCETTAFGVFPLMWALIAMPGQVIELLLGPKWSFAATLLPPLALSFMWHPIQSLNLQVLQAKGRSDLFLKVEIVKKIAGVAILCCTIPLGLRGMCWGLVANSAVMFLCNTYYNRRLIKAGAWAQLRIILPSFFASGIAAAGASFIASLFGSAWAGLATGLAAGLLIYMLWAALTRRPAPGYLRDLVSRRLRER